MMMAPRVNQTSPTAKTHLRPILSARYPADKALTVHEQSDDIMRMIERLHAPKETTYRSRTRDPLFLDV